MGLLRCSVPLGHAQPVMEDSGSGHPWPKACGMHWASTVGGCVKGQQRSGRERPCGTHDVPVSECGGLGPAPLGKFVLVSDQGVGGVLVGAVDTGLVARRSRLQEKPPRGPHRGRTSWGILGGWPLCLVASRAHSCLSPAGASCPRTLPMLSPSPRSSVQQNTHRLWDTVPVHEKTRLWKLGRNRGAQRGARGRGQLPAAAQGGCATGWRAPEQGAGCGADGLPWMPFPQSDGPALPRLRRERERAHPSGPSSRPEEEGAPGPAWGEPSGCWPRALLSQWPGLGGWSQTRRDPAENAPSSTPSTRPGPHGGHTTGRALLVQRRLLWVSEVSARRHVGTRRGRPGPLGGAAHAHDALGRLSGLREAPAGPCPCARLPPAPSPERVPSSTGRPDPASASVVCGAGPPLTNLERVKGGCGTSATEARGGFSAASTPRSQGTGLRGPAEGFRWAPLAGLCPVPWGLSALAKVEHPLWIRAPPIRTTELRPVQGTL